MRRASQITDYVDHDDQAAEMSHHTETAVLMLKLQSKTDQTELCIHSLVVNSKWQPSNGENDEGLMLLNVTGLGR
jgi:hypothetical protein